MFYSRMWREKKHHILMMGPDRMTTITRTPSRHAKRLQTLLKTAIFFSVGCHLLRYDVFQFQLQQLSFGTLSSGRGLTGGSNIHIHTDPSSVSQSAHYEIISRSATVSPNTTSFDAESVLQVNASFQESRNDNTKLRHDSVSVPTFDKKKISREQQWNNESMWTTVSSEMYRRAVFQARGALDPLVEQVYTDCRMIVGPATLEETPLERQSLISFQCDGILQNQPCHTAANLCLVISSRQVGTEGSLSFEKNKTALVMMVDSMNYLLETNEFAWKSFLNKAAYAYQSNRPLFIWIGRLDNEKQILHANENEEVYEAFGAACDPDFRPGQNTLHYYKGVAIAALFHKQSLVPHFSTAFFLDADTSFTNDAFLRMRRSFSNNEGHNLDSFGPEDYFEISPQASLWGSQNTVGQIVMNGGLLGLRNTTWTHDFCALWWYTRCGHKDQRGLWLVLFATWSATTSSASKAMWDEENEIQQFAYPGTLFLTYNFGFSAALTHLRGHFKQIQNSWEAVSQRSSEVEELGVPMPTNTIKFDGGRWQSRLKKPLELPHVLLLPLASYAHRKRNGKILELPGLKADVVNRHEEPFVVYSKAYSEVCSNKKCWPFVVVAEQKNRGYDSLNHVFHHPADLMVRDSISVQLPPPVLGQHRPEVDAVFCFARGYSVEVVARFIRSLLLTGYDGDIVLGVLPLWDSNNSNDVQVDAVKEFLAYHSEHHHVVVYQIELECVEGSRCQTQHFYAYQNNTSAAALNHNMTYLPDLRAPRKIAQLRFEYYWYWAIQYSSSSALFLSDGRDVYFQRNPFDTLHAPSTTEPGYNIEKTLHVYYEDAKVAIKDQVHNARWIKYGRKKEAVETLLDHNILCSGTTLGGAVAMESYLRAMIQMFDETQCLLGGCDQGHHNYLLHSGRLQGNNTNTNDRVETIQYFDQGSGAVNTLGLFCNGKETLRSSGLLDNSTNEVLNWDGTVSAVVHQFDRCPELVEWIERRGQNLLAQWQSTTTAMK